MSEQVATSTEHDEAKILVIEDDADMRRIILGSLSRHGYKVLAASDGESGLEIARKTIPDLIICDLMMPGMSGEQVLRLLQQDAVTLLIPVIILTADLDPKTRKLLLELGANRFLTKPTRNHDLITTVNSQLEKHRRMNAARRAEHVALEQIKTQLSVMVAHELRTPLSTLNGAYELLSFNWHNLSAEQAENMLDMMGKGIRRLKHRVEQMVLLTYIQTGSLSYATIQRQGVTFNFWKLLTSALDLARQFEYRHWDVDVWLEEGDESVMVLCNPPALKHAMAELLNNAINYSPNGSNVKVRYWLHGDELWLSILDYGQGMTSDQVRNAFEEFQQVDREVSEQQGMGMGLPLAQRIVEAHGGTLELNSVLHKGTQILIRLPQAG